MHVRRVSQHSPLGLKPLTAKTARKLSLPMRRRVQPQMFLLLVNVPAHIAQKRFVGGAIPPVPFQGHPRRAAVVPHVPRERPAARKRRPARRARERLLSGVRELVSRSVQPVGEARSAIFARVRFLAAVRVELVALEGVLPLVALVALVADVRALAAVHRGVLVELPAAVEAFFTVRAGVRAFGRVGRVELLVVVAAFYVF